MGDAYEPLGAFQNEMPPPAPAMPTAVVPPPPPPPPEPPAPPDPEAELLRSSTDLTTKKIEPESKWYCAVFTLLFKIII